MSTKNKTPFKKSSTQAPARAKTEKGTTPIKRAPSNLALESAVSLQGAGLTGQTSPYLLQHKDNPVQWFSWSDQAFAEARRLDRPVLLSIGYAACHWCHVMARESFENPDIATVINRHFIPVKVDREERPDIDTIYQAALTADGSHGGWPLTMFLTPDREPFWGGTYFPDKDRDGMTGFGYVLERVSLLWQQDRNAIAKRCQTLKQAIAGLAGPQDGPVVQNGPQYLAQSASRQKNERIMGEKMIHLLDPINGGLRGAPKFPQAPLFFMLHRLWRENGYRPLRDAFLRTIEHMSTGGIYDHLGGGYARYSVDARWLVPHFEKMLYDNALIVEWLCLGWQENQSPFWRQRVEQTIAWLEREMRLPKGLWAASLDADSKPVASKKKNLWSMLRRAGTSMRKESPTKRSAPPSEEKQEGAYYLWSTDALNHTLGRLKNTFGQFYSILDQGHYQGANILHQLDSTGERIIASLTDAKLEKCRQRLFKQRQKRPAPNRDDKALCDWNAMMIHALTRAGQVLAKPEWIDRAEKAFGALEKAALDKGRLYHDAITRRHVATLDDIAFFARAALGLYEAGGNPAYLQKAQDIVAIARNHHYDADKGGYFLSANDRNDVIVRIKTVRDLTIPAGQSILCDVFVRLWLLTGNPLYRQRADAIIALFAKAMEKDLIAHATLTNVAAFLHRPYLLHLVGNPKRKTFKALAAVANAHAGPYIVISHQPPQQKPGPKSSGKSTNGTFNGGDDPSFDSTDSETSVNGNHGSSQKKKDPKSNEKILSTRAKKSDSPSFKKPGAILCLGHQCLAPVYRARDLEEILSSKALWSSATSPATPPSTKPLKSQGALGGGPRAAAAKAKPTATAAKPKTKPD